MIQLNGLEGLEDILIAECGIETVCIIPDMYIPNEKGVVRLQVSCQAYSRLHDFFNRASSMRYVSPPAIEGCEE